MECHVPLNTIFGEVLMPKLGPITTLNGPISASEKLL